MAVADSDGAVTAHFLGNCHCVAVVLPASRAVAVCSGVRGRMDHVTAEAGHNLELSRRKLLAAAGVASGALAVAAFNGIGDAEAAAIPSEIPEPVGTPAVSGVHLQFGADASSEITVSWHTLQPVDNPRVVLGRPDGKFEQTVAAKPTSYTDAKSKQVVYAWHAKLSQLQADSAYMYGAMHDGAAPEFGTFRTSPRGRSAFTF